MEVTRETIHQAVDKLSTESLSELGQFIAYLRYKEKYKGFTWLRELYDMFAPVRAAIAETGLTEAEIDGIIDDAISASAK